MARSDPIQPTVPTAATGSTRTSAHSTATIRLSLDTRKPPRFFASLRAWDAAESCLVRGAVTFTFVPSIDGSSSEAYHRHDAHVVHLGATRCLHVAAVHLLFPQQHI